MLLHLKPLVRAYVNLCIANILINSVETAQRRRVVTVVSDDEDDGMPEVTDDDLESPSSTGRHGHQSQASLNDDEGYTADEGDNNDDDDESIDNGLRNLGVKELKSALQNEVSTI